MIKRTLLLLICALTPIAVSKHCCSKKRCAVKKQSIGPIYEAKYPFSLPPMPYAYDALEPHIDKETMKIHYTKHHQAYVNNLNAAVKDCKQLHNKTLFELLSNLADVPHDVRNAVRNQGGGHFNHSLFWQMMTPQSSKKPSGKLAEKINKTFGSFDTFKDEFVKKAKTVFGSGWAWLVTDRKGNLSVLATHNQDSPVSEQMTPILGLDVWEHAYYLKYQNKRGDYITAWWQVINWDRVADYYNKATASC